MFEILEPTGHGGIAIVYPVRPFALSWMAAQAARPPDPGPEDRRSLATERASWGMPGGARRSCAAADHVYEVAVVREAAPRNALAGDAELDPTW